MKKTVNSKKKNVNPKSLENLKPFKPGESLGALGGRPKLTEEEKKERSIQKYLETTNAKFVQALIDTGEYEKKLKQALENTIAAGKMDGFKFLNDYNGNKPKEQIEHDGNVSLGLSKELEIAVKILNERNRNKE